MSEFMVRFLICNLFICGIIGILYTAKRIFKNSLSGRMQYDLWFILLGILNRRSKRKLFNKHFWSGTWRMIIATVVTSVAAYVMTKFFPLLKTDNSFFITFPKFALITAVSGFVYVSASYLLDLEESIPIFRRISKVLFRNITDKKD